jgi:hypothetical protein
MEMTKFESVDDPGFTAIAGELRRWVKALSMAKHADISIAVASQQVQAVQTAPSPFLTVNDTLQRIFANNH